MDRQMARGSTLRRLRDHLVKITYRTAAITGSVWGAGVGLLTGLSTRIDGWLPRLQPRTSMGPREVLLLCLIDAIIGAILALVGTALLRGWTRWRVTRVGRPVV
jgi:hypothetical protein